MVISALAILRSALSCSSSISLAVFTDAPGEVSAEVAEAAADAIARELLEPVEEPADDLEAANSEFLARSASVKLLVFVLIAAGTLW